MFEAIEDVEFFRRKSVERSSCGLAYIHELCCGAARRVRLLTDESLNRESTALAVLSLFGDPSEMSNSFDAKASKGRAANLRIYMS